MLSYATKEIHVFHATKDYTLSYDVADQGVTKII